MKRRSVARSLRDSLRRSPAVVMVGPRPCGTRTEARDLGGASFAAEQLEGRLRLDLEWPEIVRRRKLVVIDEAHSWPELFPRPRGALDVDRKRVGRFLLLGSVSPAPVRSVSPRLC